MDLFKEMEVNYKDFIESANDFMDSCKGYTNIDEDEDEIIKQLISLKEHCIAMDAEIFKKEDLCNTFIIKFRGGII